MYYYVVYFEGNVFQAFGDFFSGYQCINKNGPFITEKEAIENSQTITRACIVYNAANQSFLNDGRHAGFSTNAIDNLMAWAKQNIAVFKRKKSVINILETIPEVLTVPYDTAPPVPAPPVSAPPVSAPPVPAPASDAQTLVGIVSEPAKWCFFEHNSIHHEQESLDVSIEIGNIAEKVFNAIRAYGGDFFAIAELAKGITFNMGIGMTNINDVNEILKEVEDTTDGSGVPSFLIIKIEKIISSKKISVPGLFKKDKKASLFTVDYSFFKPKNTAAQAICDDLLNTKIQHKINFLKQQTP